MVSVNTVINVADFGRMIGKRLATKTQEKILAGMERYELRPFLLGYYNNASYRLLSQPVGTITTRDRWALVTPGASLEQSHMRMLHVSEVKAAMGFPERYHLEGDNKQQVWQLGNAVCPPVMADILKRCNAALSIQLADVA
jgi:DNA (cytosine-5)-methyltransferase 1